MLLGDSRKDENQTDSHLCFQNLYEIVRLFNL